MSSINAFAVSGSGYVRVEVDWSDISGPPRKCWVYRVVAGVSTILRGGDPLLLSGGRGIVYDTEAPLDTTISYRSVIALNINGDMESGVTEWLDTANTGTVGTVSQSFDYYVRSEGQASLKLVPTGAAATVRAVSEFVPATAGVTYSFAGQIMLDGDWAGGVGIQVHWYNGTSFLSASGAMSDLWPTKGEFGSYAFAATAPATTTNMRLAAGLTGTPPASLTAYVDEAYITRSGVTTINSGTVTLTSDAKGWWIDPLHPATMVRLLQELTAGCVPTGTVYGGLGASSYAGASALLDVNGAPEPVSTWDVRKARQSQILVGTASLADLAAVEALHASGAPLLLKLPSVYGVPDHYQQHGDLAVGYLGPDQRRPFRRVQSGFATVLAPVGEAEGVFGVRYMDINRWTTYQEAATFGGGSYDTFSRTLADDWGTADSGQVWSEVGTITDFDVAASRGTMRLGAVSTTREAYDPISLADVRVEVIVGISAAPTGTTEVTTTVRARYVNANNFVDARVFRAAAGTVTVAVRQMLAGVETFTFSGALPGVTAGQELALLFEARGATLQAKAWLASATPPAAWTVTQGSVTHLAAGQVMLGAVSGSGVSNTPLTVQFGDFRATSLVAGAGNTWWDVLQGEGHV